MPAPSTKSTDYQLLSLVDLESATRIITEAFMDDPLNKFILPARRLRNWVLGRFYRAYTEDSLRQARVYGIGSPLQGVAYWNHPGQKGVNINLKEFLPFLPITLTLYYPLRILLAVPALFVQASLHRKFAPGPHYYLANIAVSNSARGQGLASRLIRPMLAAAELAGMSVYADTFLQANVPMYEHLGFYCVETRKIPSAGLSIYALHIPSKARN
jgi:ribosomal protein S18 acetylase RimI-like enzyme